MGNAAAGIGMGGAAMGQMPVGDGGRMMPSEEMGSRSTVSASTMGIKMEHNPHSAWVAVRVGRRGGQAWQWFGDRWASTHGEDSSGGVPMNASAAMTAAQSGGEGGMPSTQASVIMQAAGGGGKSNSAGVG